MGERRRNRTEPETGAGPADGAPEAKQTLLDAGAGETKVTDPETNAAPPDTNAAAGETKTNEPPDTGKVGDGLEELREFAVKHPIIAPRGVLVIGGDDDEAFEELRHVRYTGPR